MNEESVSLETLPACVLIEFSSLSQTNIVKHHRFCHTYESQIVSENCHELRKKATIYIIIYTFKSEMVIYVSTVNC